MVTMKLNTDDEFGNMTKCRSTFYIYSTYRVKPPPLLNRCSELNVQGKAKLCKTMFGNATPEEIQLAPKDNSRRYFWCAIEKVFKIIQWLYTSICI